MSHTVMSEDKNKTPQYYPRKMRRGWCVAHEVTAAGVTIERYGIRCQTYAEAYHRAEVMNREQQAEVMNRKEPLVRGFDDYFVAPHSRHTTIPKEAIEACEDLKIMAESDEAGVFLCMAENGKKIFVMGHPEYDRVTLDGEYKRDVSKNLPIEIPENYYKDNNPENRPLLMWRAHANNLYTNWLNYYVYQVTPYDLEKDK